MRTLAATAALLVLSTACLAEPNITILKTVPTVAAPRPPCIFLRSSMTTPTRASSQLKR